MATNEPMSEQALTKIRELLADDGRQWDDYSPQELYRVGWSAELLLAEVDRLRAREQALAAENEQKQAQIDAMRPMVEALAKWGIGGGLPVEFYHQARAFVAAHPATAGEAESEGEAVESEPVAGVTFADTDGNDPDAYDEAESECE